MARKVFVAGSGGSGGGAYTGAAAFSLPLVSEEVLTADVWAAGPMFVRSTQINANQLMLGYGGYSSTNNLCGWTAQAYQVDESGQITLGTKSSLNNGSGAGWSTANYGEPVPGRLACLGRIHHNGSYNITSWGATVSSNNTLQAGKAVYGDYNNSYPHPSQNGLTGAGSGAYYGMAYNANSYGYASYLTYNGSSFYNFNSATQLNSYSSTGDMIPAAQHWSDTASACGMGYDHRDSTGFYLREYHASGATNLGYNTSLLPGGSYSQMQGFRLSANAVYADFAGKYMVTNGAGSVVASGGQYSMNGVPIGQYAPNGNANSCVALGNGYFASPGTDALYWVIYKVSIDGSYNLTISPKCSVLADGVGTVSAATQGGWRLAGSENQYLVIARPNSIQVYDSSSLAALMV